MKYLLPTLAQEFPLCGGRLFIAPTSAHDVVAVAGSVFGGSNMVPNELDFLPSLAAELLDAGTKSKNKNTIRNELANRGISLAFSASGDRTEFSGHCFPEDLPVLLKTICECLGEANFPESEVKNMKARMQGEIADEKSNTRERAERAFAGLLFDPSHVNYIRPLASVEKSLTKAKRAQLIDFKKKLGKGGLVLALTGDVDVETVRKTAEKAFAKLPLGTPSAIVKIPNKKKQIAGEAIIPIPDKANIDVLYGAAIPLKLSDAEYHPMKVLSEMLGGGFASHLMQTIRERDGLTYGVYARLSGMSEGADGSFKIWATFSPEKYTLSVSKLKEEVQNFFSTGITEESLAKKKEEIIGSYLVSLSTSHNLANILHRIGAQGYPLTYLTDYPNIIDAISLEQLTSAARLIPLKQFSLAASGTFPKS